MSDVYFGTVAGSYWGSLEVQALKDDLHNLADVDLHSVITLIEDARIKSQEIPTERGRLITDKLTDALRELNAISSYLKSYEPKPIDDNQAIG